VKNQKSLQDLKDAKNAAILKAIACIKANRGKFPVFANLVFVENAKSRFINTRLLQTFTSKKTVIAGIFLFVLH